MVAFGSRMTNPKKTRAEIETMIANEVRKRPLCEGFQSISIYRTVDGSAEGISNWSPSVTTYGDAGEEVCEEALREIVPRLQQQYDISD
jgi:hypothetical protein